MEPLTWRKEGISNHWAGPRGLRKSCCKVGLRFIKGTLCVISSELPFKEGHPDSQQYPLNI